MDVLNFGHGVFSSFGAYVSLIVLGPLAGWVASDSLWLNIGVLLACIAVAMLVTGALGWAFERLVIRPVYGQHLKQILITIGGMIRSDEHTPELQALMRRSYAGLCLKKKR